jgi:hypothetical protein
MLAVARDYCALIEVVGEGKHDPTWLEQMSALLPRLHAAIVALGGPEDVPGRDLKADLDARFELFTRLRGLLGDRDAYWMEFDVAQDGQTMSGSLADDLTDIYCELKHGLRELDGDPDGPERALADWRKGFRVHWGQHLVDAERHLYALEARNQLGL